MDKLLKQRQVIANELRFILRWRGLLAAQEYRINLKYLGKYPNGIARYRRYRGNGKVEFVLDYLDK